MAEPSVYGFSEQQNTAYPPPGSYTSPYPAPSYPQVQPAPYSRCQPGAYPKGQAQPGEAVIVTRGNADPVLTANSQGGCCGSDISEHYHAKAGLATGVVHLVIAVLSLILGVVSSLYLSFLVGYGIWSAIIIYFPTGILGLASKKKNSCVVVAYMVMAILTSLCAIGMVAYESFVAAVRTYYEFCYRPSPISANICFSRRPVDDVIIHSLLALLALVEFINAIVSAAYCCKGHFCCCAPPPTNQGTVNTPTVVYNM